MPGFRKKNIPTAAHCHEYSGPGILKDCNKLRKEHEPQLPESGPVSPVPGIREMT